MGTQIVLPGTYTLITDPPNIESVVEKPTRIREGLLLLNGLTFSEYFRGFLQVDGEFATQYKPDIVGGVVDSELDIVTSSSHRSSVFLEMVPRVLDAVNTADRCCGAISPMTTKLGSS